MARTDRLKIRLTALAAAVILCLAGSPRRAEGGAPMFDSQLIFDHIEGNPSSHAATLTELPNGDIMAAWYSGAYERARDVAVFYSILPKGGGQWSKPLILHDTITRSEGNPVLFTGKDGRVWFFFVTMFGETWADCRIYYKTSADGGKTWSAQKTLIEELGWMTRNRPLELADGTLILPIYNETTWTPAFMATKDGGATWRFLARDIKVPGGAIQPAIIKRADGSLLALLRTGEAGGNIWSIESADGGKTWAEPARTKLPNPNAGIDMVKLANGHALLVFNDSPYDRTPLSVALSEDEGKTWPYVVKLEKTYGEFSYPAVIQSSDGTIHVVYTYKRTSIKHASFNEEWIKSKAKKTEK
jgi:predicted neuraminidase